MCLYPTLIENRKYRPNAKNKGIPPPINDQRIRMVSIGCQQCIECRKQKARQWQIRLLEHIKTNTNGKFIGLTFSNQAIAQLNTQSIKRTNKKTQEIETIPINKLKGYDKDNAIATLAVRRFLERWRKQYKKSIQHWLITEIGHKGTENIHLHGIIWTDKSLQEVENIWKYGFIWKGHKKNGKIINYVNGRTISYMSKYVHKIDLKHKTFTGIILTSPGIGKNYTNTYNSTKNKYQDKETNELYKTSTGHTMAMPIYWRNKIYTEEQREKLWIQKLDKEERWIRGEKIDISKGYKKYDNILEHYRKENAELGYGSNNTDEKRKKYELERRKILQETRIQKASGGVFKRERINKKAACGAIQDKNT